jgi:dTDP-L-rhamnose 4-epimerase
VAKNVLITGGAGFIGSHVADQLLVAGYRVRALDDLSPQVHGDTHRPEYLDPDVELIVGDVRDAAAVRRALRGIDLVVHFAARVGVGQSMYALAEYTGINSLGTAVLLETVLDQPVERIVVASSMSVYGEGLYRTRRGRHVTTADRPRAQLERGEWEPVGSNGEQLTPIPTPETKPPTLTSVYALNKFDQERMCLLFGAAYNVPVVALRFFNVYGPRQALSNPYTGVLAIFASRLLNERPPLIYEDGHQRRDFVSVKDVARACRLALESRQASGHAINVGSGRSVSVREIAAELANVLDTEEIEPKVTGKYRAGDIRHCFADISLARELLGYEPRVSLAAGMEELASWLEGQAATDRVDDAAAELTTRGLTI